MNYDVERSSNAVTDKTPSADVLAWPATGRTQSTVHCDKEERIDGRQKRRVGEWSKKPNSLSKRMLNGILSILHGVIDEGRIVVQGLRPPSIPSTRLEHAFFEILEEIACDAQPPFRIVVTGQPKALSSAIEEQVYMIQREALINAIRHSDAASIEAEVEYFPCRLRLVIRDNGCGFEPKVLKLGRGSRCGIRTMVEQARAMGAQLQIWTRPGSGTEVELSLPFGPRSLPVLNP